jgi:hypothetical protein
MHPISSVSIGGPHQMNVVDHNQIKRLLFALEALLFFPGAHLDLSNGQRWLLVDDERI